MIGAPLLVAGLFLLCAAPVDGIRLAGFVLLVFGAASFVRDLMRSSR